VLITGASGGLGGAIARCFAGPDVQLALHCHRNHTAAEVLATEVDGHVFQADLSCGEGCDQLLKALSRWAPDGIDGFIHAAGSTRDRAVLSLSEADWDDVLETHLLAPARLLRAGLIRPNGFVLLIGSGAGRFGREGQAAYAAAKAGVVGLVEGSARALGRDGIRINAVVPGPLDTAMWRATPAPARRSILAANALERVNTVEQVAAFICLLSGMSATSGQVLDVGSRVAR